MLRWPKSFKAGTEVRGANGDLVATICQDVIAHTVMDAEQWVLPDGRHPLAHSVMPEAVLYFLQSAALKEQEER